MRDWMLPLIFSVVIVVIQVVFAPILTVFSTVPSFIVSFVLVLSIMRRPDTTYVYAFVLGLIADLLTQTPVGLTPLLLLIAVFCLSRVFEVLDDTSLAMPLIALAATLLVFELLFAGSIRLLCPSRTCKGSGSNCKAELIDRGVALCHHASLAVCSSF